MLNFFRKSSRSIFAKFLYFLIAASFVLWGIDMSSFSLSNQNHVAKVEDQIIDTIDFEKYFQSRLSAFQQRFGDSLDAKKAVEMGLFDYTLQYLIDEKVLLQSADVLGLKVNEKTLKSIISQDPSFQDESKKFNRNQFDLALQESGLSAKKYFKTMEQQIIVRQLIGALFNGVTVSQNFSKPIAEITYENRSGQYFFLPYKKVPKVSSPTTKQLQEYLEQEKENFTSPELRTFTFATVSLNDIKNNIVITDAEIKKYYDENQSEFEIPQQREMVQIYLPPDQEKQINEAWEKIKSGQDFADVASQYMGKSRDKIKLEKLSKDEILPVIQDPVFKLAQGAFTKPLKSVLGWHIIKVKKIIPSYTSPLSSVRQVIKKELIEEKMTKKSEDLYENIEDALAQGDDFQKTVDRFNFKSQTVTANDQGYDKSQKEIKFPSNDIIIEAFQIKEEGQESMLIKYDQANKSGENYFIVKLKKIIPPSLLPLNQIKDTLTKSWIANKTHLKAMHISLKFKNTQLTPDAKKYKRYNIPATVKNSMDMDIPEPIISALFQANKNQRRIVALDDGLAIVELKNIRLAQVTEQQNKIVSQAIESNIKNDMISEFIKYQSKKFEIQKNKEIIDRMNQALTRDLSDTED